MPILITQRNAITSLLGVSWLKQLPITINKFLLDKHTNQSEAIHTKFNKLFGTNHIMKNTEEEIQPIPYHLKQHVKNELDRLMKFGHFVKLELIEADCFVSSVKITVKKDKTVKIALDASKLNENCWQKRPHLPNMEELLNQMSAELSKYDRDPLLISVTDLDYAYGQMKLAPQTSKHCKFAKTGEKINGHNRFL